MCLCGVQRTAGHTADVAVSDTAVSSVPEYVERVLLETDRHRTLLTELVLLETDRQTPHTPAARDAHQLLSTLQ